MVLQSAELQGTRMPASSMPFSSFSSLPEAAAAVSGGLGS